MPRPPPPSTGGACVQGCGRCCDPVVLPFTRIQAMTDRAISEEERRWVVEDLVPMTYREARVLADYQFVRPTLGVVGGVPVAGPAFYFRCRNFDREARTCAIYDSRPAACRQYPWYGDRPNPAAAIPPECGYNVDVGREPVPVVLTRKPT